TAPRPPPARCPTVALLSTFVAGPDGAVITLGSTNPALASVPARVTIPAAANSATFTITTQPLAVATDVTILAARSMTLRQTLQLRPPAALASQTPTPPPPKGGKGPQEPPPPPGAAPPAGVVAALPSSNPASVTESDFKVELSTDALPAGTPITFTISNTGPSKHELVLEKAGSDDEPLVFNGKGQEAEDIEPGTRRTVEWTIPEAGQYQLACHLPGHYEAGMKTLFTVSVSAGQAAAQATAQLPKTGGEEPGWLAALGLAALAGLSGGLVLRRGKA